VKISLVTLTHDRKAYVLELLQSVYAGSLVPDEVIVVDNASSDDTVAAVQERFPSVTIARNDRNVLVSAAFNRGIGLASGDFVIAIADDNTLDQTCVEELVKCAVAHPEAGVIAPTMFYYDAPDRVWFQKLSIDFATGHTSFDQRRYDGPADFVKTDSMPNCIMFARSTLDRVGFLDESAFPMHHEEADYCERCRRAGLGVIVAVRAREWHRVPLPQGGLRIGSGDFNIDDPRRAYLNGRSRVFLAKRHATFAQRATYFALFMPLTTLAYVAISLLTVGGKRGVKTALAFLRGTIDGVRLPVPVCPTASPDVSPASARLAPTA
jgi:GT2 family glycosyltransferase